MKKLSLAMFLATMSLMAADYSQLSMDELTELRSTVSAEDREDFRAEMRSRVEAMTPENKAAFMKSRQASGGQGANGRKGDNNR